MDAFRLLDFAKNNSKYLAGASGLAGASVYIASGAPEIELVAGFLGDAMKTRVSQELIVWGVIWFVVQKKVAKHFGKIEESLRSVASNLTELKDSLIRVETSHSERLHKVEKRISVLETNNNKEV